MNDLSKRPPFSQWWLDENNNTVSGEELYQAFIRRMSDERLIYGPMNLTTKEREALEKRIDEAEDDLG